MISFRPSRWGFCFALFLIAGFGASARCAPLPPPVVSAVPSQSVPPAQLAQPRASVAPVGVARAACFPVETLPPDLRARAETILLNALDGEALYTLVGGIKPMSSGWLSARFELDKPDPQKLDELRQIVATFRCGDEIEAHLHAFARADDRVINLDSTLFSRPALRAMIAREQLFWNEFAVTPATHPLEVVLKTEYAPASARFRGYGYLFGYPRHAVDFFVSAAATQDADPAKKLVPRDFFSIPTFKSDTNRFVYAIPQGQAPNATDLALRARCAPILAEYKRRRALYIGEGKAGAVALLRDWFDNGNGRCSPSFAAIPGSSK